jgi:NitT/TauT family transport system permease protein
MPHLAPTVRSRWQAPVTLADLFLMLVLAILALGMVEVFQQWAASLHTKVDIDLSPWSLPNYTILSLSRGLLAYVISLGFTLVYGYWAAKHRASGRLLIPMLDILQSIPVLGFMPGLVLALIAIFPTRNIGLEMAAVLMIFTGQAWNMTFSYHRSLTSLPKDQAEAAQTFRFSWWQRLRWVELPASVTGLVWNSMMSMAGGWFFLMLSETFTLGERDFRLPGLGSYMQEALNQGNWLAMTWGVVAMVTMIVLLDQILWRPLVVWAERFRVEDSAAEVAQQSWFLDLLHHSKILRAIGRWRALRQQAEVRLKSQAPRRSEADLARQALAADKFGLGLAWTALTALIILLVWGAWVLLGQLLQVPWAAPHVAEGPVPVSWLEIFRGSGLTALRVAGALILGTMWALPVGLAIGRSPTWSRRLQPVVQVAASFPAPMLFPLFLMIFQWIGLPLGIGSMILMLLGTQWYVLFNVIAGAQAIPSDLREATTAFRLTTFQRFFRLEAPGIFPALVTGWVTAAGGAWNASIVAEYLTWQNKVYTVDGLGATISVAATRADYPGLAASVTFMAIAVVLINVIVWRRLHHLAQGKFSLTK